jgi:multidrug efflux pump subunit AcrA (membrane-fusion protein)
MNLFSRTLLSLSCLGLPALAQTLPPALPAAATSPLSSASVQFQGTVLLPVQQSEVVSMPLAGVVQAVLVSPMSVVKAGQPVARILSPQLADMQREWRAAVSQARLARAKAQRDDELFKDGIIAEQRRHESMAQAGMAELAEQERRQALKLAGVADKQLQDSREPLSPALDIAAPTGGTVLEQIASPGQRLEAGSPLVRLGRADKLAIEFQAPASQLAGLRVGDALVVEGCSKPARVSAISPELSSATQNLMARAELVAAENCLRINQFVRLRWQRTKP